VAKVRSNTVEMEYRVNPAALPLDSVRLWFTRDEGVTWTLFGQDPDRQPPVAFRAAEEGLYGFYLVVSNAAGASGAEPTTGAQPQQWAFLDGTAPIVQLHRPQVDRDAADGARLSIRWTAVDGHFPPRPIELTYRLAPDGPWQVIARHLANTGRYDWKCPDGLTGTVILRLSATDEGGNTSEAAVSFDLAPVEPMGSAAAAAPGGTGPNAATLTAAVHPIDEKDRERALKLYQQGLWHRDRGERRLAMARLRDALRLDPSLAVALVDLGWLLYLDNDYPAAGEAYELALRQDPHLRTARDGLVRVQIARRQFDQAAEQLRRMIQDNPIDVEAWLALGDVAIYRGDELGARESYSKAATLDPTAGDTITRAKLRLADIDGLRERFAEPNKQP